MARRPPCARSYWIGAPRRPSAPDEEAVAALHSQAFPGFVAAPLTDDLAAAMGLEEGLAGVPMLIVQPLDKQLKIQGAPIVVADGIAVRLKQGMDPKKAAIEAARQPSMPLLGATIVAIMAFYPIFASVADAGEYCRTLFIVVAFSLLLSWLIAVTITPIQCMQMLPVSKKSEDEADEYGGKFFSGYRKLLESAIRRRWLFMGGMVGLLLVSVVGFGGVRKMFFPDSRAVIWSAWLQSVSAQCATLRS